MENRKENFPDLSNSNRLEKEKRFGQKGTIIWMTGLSGSGKTTLSLELEKTLCEKGKLVYVLDGDLIRAGLNSDLGFSQNDRHENIRRIGEVSRLFADAGLIVIVAFISPFRDDRNRVRNAVQKGRFVEIFLDCSLETCEKRDPKGLYKKARRGEIKEFTGISSPYEPPENPELRLKTDSQSVEESIQQVIKYLEDSEVFYT